jgi:hypothetical protein
MLAYLNKQASISCITRDRRQDKRKQGKQALARDRSKTFGCLMLAYLHRSKHLWCLKRRK